MSERGLQLLRTADSQISELIGLVSARGEAGLRLACPGREKMGDGTVAACAAHTADRYLWIAGFLQGASQTPGAHADAEQDRHTIGRFLRTPGHAPGSHAKSGHEKGGPDGDYTAENVDLDGLLERLSAGRDALSLLAGLNDDQLDAVPPSGSFRFCDGQRTLEQVITSLLKHQDHQSDAIRAAVS